MKSQFRALAIAVGLLFSAASFAEVPATTAPVHAATTPATAAPAVPASPAPAATHVAHTAKTPSAKPKAAPMPTTAAAGGEPGKVWINAKSKTKTYHCFGTKFYGKTKAGEYMTEADAKAKGYHGIQGKDCPATK